MTTYAQPATVRASMGTATKTPVETQVATHAYAIKNAVEGTMLNRSSQKNHGADLAAPTPVTAGG